MARPLAVAALVAMVLVAGRSEAAVPVEAALDLAVGPDYVWSSAEVTVRLLSERWILGAGAVAVGDYHRPPRLAARAITGVDLEEGALQLTIDYAPAQDGLGWASGQLEASLRQHPGAVEVEETLRLVGRRLTFAEPTAGLIGLIDQAEAQLEVVIESAGRVRVELLGAAAIYDADLPGLALAAADLGPFVSFGARPERLAGRALVDIHVAQALWATLALGGIAFASEAGGAALPRAGLRLVLPGGASLRAAMEALVPVDAGLGPRLSFLMEVGWSR